MRYEEVVDAVNEILGQYSYRLTVRQIYYRLVSPPYQLFANLPNLYKQFDKILTSAREKGDVDWHRIEDRARTTLGGDFGHQSPDEFIESQIESFKDCWRYYTRPLWENQSCYVEVWVEKDALATLFSRVADEYRVLTFPSRGYSSLTKFMESLEDRFVRCWKRGQPVRILHFSDHDPSGIDMFHDITRRLEEYLIPILRKNFTNEELDKMKELVLPKWKEQGDSFFTVYHYGLTYEQVQRFNLPPNPTKKADPRAKEYVQKYGDQCWELDALPPDELERIVREAIVEHIDRDVWNKTIKQIEEEREKLKDKFSKVKIEFE